MNSHSGYVELLESSTGRNSMLLMGNSALFDLKNMFFVTSCSKVWLLFDFNYGSSENKGLLIIGLPGLLRGSSSIQMSTR